MTTLDLSTSSVRSRRRRAGTFTAATLAAAFLSLTAASPAFAHDELISSAPEPGQVYETAPEQIELDFSDDIIELGTSVTVVDHHGEEIDVGEPVVAGPQVTASLPTGLAGDYQVRWRAVSSDGHPIEGTIDFGVGADATGVWEEQAPHDEASAGADDHSDGADAAAESGALEPWTIVVAVLGGLALIAVIAAVVVKTRRKAPGAE